MTIVETFSEETRSFAGRNLGEVAAELGKSPFATMLDLALLDDLKPSFMPRTPGDDDESWKLRAEVWQDPRSIVGASDAGAHLDMINTFLFTTAMLEAVRERDLAGLEEAVHQLTDVPARSYGIRERGRLAEGWRAEGAVITVEVAAGEDMTPPPEFSVLEARRYGAAKIVFLRYGAPA